MFIVEVGGRWAPEAAAFFRMLARARAADAQLALRPAAQISAWVQRWNGIIALAVQHALATSLLELPGKAHDSAAGREPVFCTSSSHMPDGKRGRLRAACAGGL